MNNGLVILILSGMLFLVVLILAFIANLSFKLANKLKKYYFG